MTIELRPYQEKIIDEARRLMSEGSKSVLICSATGSGKTLLTAHMLKRASEKGFSSLFTVHRRELIKQSSSAFNYVGLPHSIVSSGWEESPNHPVKIGSVQTLIRRNKIDPSPKLIVVDECHHIAAQSWSNLFSIYPDAFLIGLTATPVRLDGEGLNKFFKTMVNGPSVQWLIENKFLSNYRLFAPNAINTAGLHTRMGDFVREELENAADKPLITGDAISHYIKHAKNKRAVVFCVSILHSKHVVEQFNANGIHAVHVDGETPTEERDEAIRKFTEGKIMVLSNVDLFGEGFDVPSIEAAILLRPTKSLGLYLQQVGRSLRPSPGKDYAIILDHAGNCQRHGLPDDDREWTLNGSVRRKEKKDGEEQIKVKICKKCFAAQFAGATCCKICGFIFETNARKVEEVEGTLQEIDTAALRINRASEQGRAKSLEALISLGKQRGYKRPEMWARFVYRARLTKQGRG